MSHGATLLRRGTSQAELNSAKQVLQLTVQRPGCPHDLGQVPACFWAPNSLLSVRGVHSCNRYSLRAYCVPGAFPSIGDSWEAYV